MEKQKTVRLYGYFFSTLYAYYMGLVLLLLGSYLTGSATYSAVLLLVKLIKILIKVAIFFNSISKVVYYNFGLAFMIFGFSIMIAYHVINYWKNKA
jgi:hypothetical protein